MQVEIIWVRETYRFYLRLLLRGEEFNANRLFTLEKSLQHKPVR